MAKSGSLGSILPMSDFQNFWFLDTVVEKAPKKCVKLYIDSLASNCDTYQKRNLYIAQARF